MKGPITSDELTLEFRKFALSSEVAEELLLDQELSVGVRDAVFGRMVFELRSRLLVDQLPPEQVTTWQWVPYEVPASTWQTWKQRHARRWYARRLVARWPVRFGPDPDGRGTEAVAVLDLERYRSYPRAKVRLPHDQFGPEVLGHVLRGPNWRIGGGDA